MKFTVTYETTSTKFISYCSSLHSFKVKHVVDVTVTTVTTTSTVITTYNTTKFINIKVMKFPILAYIV